MRGYPAAGELAGVVSGDDESGEEVFWWAVAGGAVVKGAV